MNYDLLGAIQQLYGMMGFNLESFITFLVMFMEVFIWMFIFFFLDLRLWKLKIDHPRKYIGRKIIFTERICDNNWETLLTTKYSISTWDTWDAIVMKNKEAAAPKKMGIVVDKKELTLIVEPI